MCDIILAVEVLAAGQFAAKTSDISSVSGVYAQEASRTVFFGIESQIEDREAKIRSISIVALLMDEGRRAEQHEHRLCVCR